jgi:outer membrane protein assembly factor BamA
VEIRGRDQVSTAQIGQVLEEEGLVEGADLIVPEDSRVDRARERLRATGYFRLVNIRFRPVPERRDSAVLIVELEERSSVHVSDVYLGTSRMTPFRGGLVLEERNFLGRAVHLGGGFVWSTLPQIAKARRQQAYRLFAEAPRIGMAPFGVLGSAYVISASEPYRVRGAANDPNPGRFRTFDYDRAGGVLGLSFPLLPQLTLGVDYRFERVDAILPVDPVYVPPDGMPIAVELDVLDGVHRHTAAHFALLWDGREDAVLAGHGARFVLDLQVSSPAIGSEYEYIKLAASGAYTFRLPWRHWMTPSFSGGQITGEAPRFERFFSGDLSDWTPSREQELRFSTRNPIDVFGLGIDTRTFGALFGRVDLEYVWPLFRRTKTRRVYGGDLFLSTGIYTIVGDADERATLDAVGERIVPLGFNANFGLRLDTPLGTLDLSVGNVLRRTPL